MRRLARRRPDGERGAAAAETSLVVGLLLLLALGAVEYGMVFQEWISVTSASREAARTAASAGDVPDADCFILEAAAGPLSSLGSDNVMEVSIYRTDTSGTKGPANVYRPSLPTDSPGSLRCGTWFPIAQNWPESIRDNDGTVRDWAGVEIEFDHDWMTNFLWFSGSVCDRGTAPGVDCWKQATVMHIEPDPNPF